MRYEGIIYRPPSEAYSFILQVTIGCSHNQCAFCNMYKEKKFRIRPMQEIKEDLMTCKNTYGTQVKRIFLADGDALILPTEQLLDILYFIQDTMPWVERVSSYAAPKDLLLKSPEELSSLYKAGLLLLYLGAESGDDKILQHIHKGVTSKEIITACHKASDTGFAMSITLISGLAGVAGLKEHAIASARLISEIRPKYLGFLTLMLEPGTETTKEVKEGKLQLLNPEQVMDEMELFLTNIDSPGTIFRANHASNYVSLKGTLNTDKELLLSQIQHAREHLNFKSEGFRRL